MDNREELKRRYLKLIELLIDAAFDGKPQRFLPCDGVVLELYLENEELHWRAVQEE